MKPRRRFTIESLEARTLLAAAGGPWPNPRDLTLSFAPDGTQIGLFANELFATLGRNRAASQWQTDILRAFQTWAAATNVDIGLVPDTGRPFGAAGLAQGDPRFGDIRIGAFLQARVIASAVPYRGIAGSWSGDVFLNSSLAAGLHSADIDLYSVLLNEAGNALGLADTDDPESVMYTDYRGQRDGLGSQDVAAIQALYGERQPDAYEGDGGNDIPAGATLLTTTLVAGTLKAAVEADLHRAGDVDYYRIATGGQGGRITVRLVAAGESLLVGAVDVTRASGATLASAAAAGPLANNVEVTVPMTPAGGDILIRVASNATDVFGVGRYRLEVDLRSGDATAPPVAAQAPGDAPAGTLLPETGQIRSYPAVNGFLDEEVGQNDSFSTATVLETPLGFLPHSRYEAVGAIRSASDVDVYRVTAPEVGDRRLTVHLDTFDVRLVDFHIGLYDADENLIAEQAVPQADGRIVLDVTDIESSQEYFLRIAAGGPGGSAVGNYVVVADFIREDPFMTLIGSGTLAQATDRDVQPWHVTRTFLYRFDLRPQGGATEGGAGSASGAAVRFEIVDEHGAVMASLLAPTGATSTQFVWLPAGSFDFVIQPDGAAADGFLPIDYSLFAAALSDDVGPGLVDPTESPLPGDADQSGVVDRGDVAAVAADYGRFADSLPPPADFDGDGDVDLADLAIVVANLGRALLPDLSTSTSTSTSSGGPGTATGGSDTGAEAASALVRSVGEHRTVLATAAENRLLSAAGTRRGWPTGALWHGLPTVPSPRDPQSNMSRSGDRDTARSPLGQRRCSPQVISPQVTDAALAVYASDLAAARSLAATSANSPARRLARR